jgi:hypothetical protein
LGDYSERLNAGLGANLWDYIKEKDAELRFV